MLIASQKLLGTSVLSVRAGGPVAQISELIIDPDYLKIIAFRCTGGFAPNSGANLLSASSIREYSSLGFVIDDVEEFIDGSEVVHIDKVLKLHFKLIGLKVETKKGSHLGKISEFTLTPDDFTIQQIIVRRPTLKSFLDPELTISRKEIIKVTDDKIVVKDEEDTLKQRAAKEDFVPNFVNPFRKSQEPDYAPVDTDSHHPNPD